MKRTNADPMWELVDVPLSKKNRSVRSLAFFVLAGILLGAITSVVLTTQQSTDTVTQAKSRQQTREDRSLGLIDKVEAYENPFAEETQYQNPFDSSPNPFDEVEK